MAQKFVGFKPETLQKKILPALGYDGPTDEKSINQFLAANPAAAAKIGKYTAVARQMVEGKPMMNAGGAVGSFDPAAYLAANPDVAQNSYYADKPLLHYQHFGEREGREFTTIKPPEATDPKAKEDAAAGGAATPAAGAVGSFGDSGILSGGQATKQIQTDPTKMVTQANVVSDDGGAATQIAAGSGDAGAAAQATPTVATPAPLVAPPTFMPGAKGNVTRARGDVDATVSSMNASQGNVSAQAQVDPAKMNPADLAQLGVNAAQLGKAQQVKAPTPMQVTQDQLISGTSVDQSQVDQTFGTGEVEAASVKDELDDLMQDFEGGQTPSWAAGAMRAANAQMAARGLSASSMAGMAVVQAAMESALPIAAQDASNKQQMAMMKAEQRAKFMGMKFDQEFQTKVKNAARISEIANINFSAEQQVALENARLAQTVDLANLDNRQAKVMADVASMAQVDMTNLNNRQQAQVQNAQAFLQMDMQNLSNEQQTTMFRGQSRVNSILSDQAASNAMEQFNATSENQANQFFQNLSTQVAQFNTEQSNAMLRFNAGEANALSQFNASQINARDQFNAQNHLIIQQANARWAQSITTAANAAANQANRDAAMVSNNLTRAAYDEVLQRERDILGWAWKSGENAAQRDNAIATAKISADGSSSDAFSEGLGSFAAKLTEAALTNIFMGGN